jgi:pimeloyl-ACP methyl ester carboxylesterase
VKHVAAVAAVAAMLHPSVGFRVLYRALAERHDELVRHIWVPYTAWDGRRREALLVLPAWYGPGDHPRIPVVISPHGRGCSARGNAAYWGSLPAFGPFGVVSPQGQGRRLTAYSWGWRGQIADLARMPSILRHALPWLRIARVYAVGSSMGGQESLLLDALHPRLLGGVVALDSATNLTARYSAFASLPGGRQLQQLMRLEVGGAPAAAPDAYTARSPISYARRLARSGVPLYIWWSTHDRVVRNQRTESGLLYRTIKRIDPDAPVYEYVGSWSHSAEMHPMTQLPLALVELGLIHADVGLARERDDSLTIPVQVPSAFLAPPGDDPLRPADLSSPGAFDRALPAGVASAVAAGRHTNEQGER